MLKASGKFQMNRLLLPEPLIKSPLNYIGGKYKLLPQILPLFPCKIKNFVDLFAGGGNVGINVVAERIFLNDNLIYLIDLFRYFKETPVNEILFQIEQCILKFNLSLENEEGYLALRNSYNLEKSPLKLFILVCFSFNHQIRFNSKHCFNVPFGKNRSEYNNTIKYNLMSFIRELKNKNIYFSVCSFEKFDFESFDENDLFYCDPPYLISTGTYNDGKRGFSGWSETEEKKLLTFLDQLDAKNIKFALSNLLFHKGNRNVILNEWLSNHKKYNVQRLDFHYNNSSYNLLSRKKDDTQEVLITNYR